jgi:hypothetical protein
MSQRHRHTTATQAKVSFLLRASLALLLLTAPVMADEAATTVAAVPTENSLMQQAVEHAKQLYGIDILITDELLRSPVAPWTKATVTAERWIDQVFKSYDKIVFYNDQGKINAIHIVGLKNSKNAVAQKAPAGSEPMAHASVPANAAPSSAADEIVTADPTADLSPEQEGFIIHPPTEEQELPEGVAIYQNNGEADDLAIAGVILH